MPVKTSLKDNKLNKKAKVNSGKSKNSGNGVGNVESERKGARISKKVGSRGNSGDDVDGFKSSNGKRSSKLRTKDRRKKVEDDGNEGLMSGRGKRSLNLRTKDDWGRVGNERSKGFKSGNLNKKRKRVIADEILGNVHISSGNNHKENVVKGKQTKKAEFLNLEQSGLRSTMAGKTKSKATETVDKKKLRSLSNVKTVEKVEDAEMNGMLKKRDKSLSGRKQFYQNQSQKRVDTVKRSTKEKAQGKKSTTDEAKETEQKPKKKKRIQLDPYDTSNKRLDDGFPTNDGEEKKADLPTTNKVELSKNAQFRAIRPSPSILSFVEDNLLGRRREIEIKRAGYNIELSAPLDNIPSSTGTERERIEEPVFRNKLSFFAAAKVSSSFPPPELPEIAFAGRSNVGKSSLLNSLTRQWGVVRTSDKPGLTQTINFFKLGSKLCLVDLPGYGFAYAKEDVKEAWEELVKEYVSTRVGLKRVCLLVDTKWGMKPRDYELVDLMERSRTKYQIVLTKTDLVFPIDVARRAMQIEESLKQKKSAVQPVMMVSSKSGAGIRSLRTVLSKIARFVKP